MKKAILFGASGFIGSYLLQYLLEDADYDRVTIIVRKPLNINHPKLNTRIGDYETLSSLKEHLIADDVFITLGTTQKKTPDKDEYYRIDHDYPVLAAKLAQENGAKSIYAVTAIGANADSPAFYIKTKGEAERDIIALNYEHTYLFRPSLILGKRNEKRPIEKIMMGIWKVVNPLFVGELNKYKGMKAQDIAQAMIYAAKNPTEKLNILQWSEMNALSRNT